jgi:hypothetical protein
MLMESFNGKPQASSLNFASAYGSPLNENAQSATKSTACGPLSRPKSTRRIKSTLSQSQVP